MTADRHKSYTTSSEREHSPSDKKMITGVLESGVISFELGIMVDKHLCAFHCRSNTVRAVARTLLKSVPRPLRPINLSTSSSGVLVLSFSKRTFPSQSIHSELQSPLTYLGSAVKEDNAICISSDIRGRSLSYCHLS